MLKIISRPPNDEFTLYLFQELVTKGPGRDCESYYMWGTPPERLESFFENTLFQSSTVIIGIKDLLDLWKGYSHWQHTQQAGVDLIVRCVRRYPDTMFVIFTSLENLYLELQEPNVQIIPWGGDWVNQLIEYRRLEPVADKNFASTKTFISLNRNVRDHRVVLLSYLFGQDLDQHGLITFLGIGVQEQPESENFRERIQWEFDSHNQHVEPIMQRGYERFYSNQSLVVDDYRIYAPNNSNDNFSNFNRQLRHKYRDSFVEIICESSFVTPAFMLTEKTHHSFYAFNFPILIAGAGAVAHLREIGFDMFDDIIDHSYDSTTNPVDRITQAIDLNRAILTQPDLAKALWQANQDRFWHNLDVARSGMYSWYKQRTLRLIDQIRWQ